MFDDISPDSVVLGLIIIAFVAAISLWMAWYERRRDRHERQWQIDTETAQLADLAEWVGGSLDYRRPNSADAETMLTIDHDPINIAAQRLGTTNSSSLEHYVDAVSNQRPDLLLGIERETGEPVGYTSIRTTDRPPDGSLTIGLMMHPDHRGKGYGRELLGTTIAFAREVLRKNDLDAQIHIGTATDNHAMQHVMGQLGYEPEPGTEPYIAPNGETIDSYWYRCAPPAPPPRIVDDDYRYGPTNT